MRILRPAIAAAAVLASTADAQRWIDAKTGQAVPSGPMVQRIEGLIGDKFYFEGIVPDIGDPNRAFDPISGRNFVGNKCPPPKEKTITQPPKTAEQVGSAAPVKLNSFD